MEKTIVEWHPVSEKPPQDGLYWWIADSDDLKEASFVGFYNGIKFRNINGHVVKISHWAVLEYPAGPGMTPTN